MSSETSPLLPQPDGPSVELSKGRFSPYRRVLLASLFLSISFVFVSSEKAVVTLDPLLGHSLLAGR